ncbi:hypothetical protein ABW19_dt0202059 [Dactylella cylindrospora]|nr:hypothetical protein ABW19_dt0202059 [Dactylella cylindrospora]
MYCTIGDSDEEIHYLIDRKNDYYFVRGLHFPKTAEEFASFHTSTVIDGELVIDEKPDGRQVLKFLVFDCLILDGQLLTQRPLDKRLGVGSGTAWWGMLFG